MTEATKPLNVGWIGTGVMGSAMCGHLLAAGHKVSIHTRTPKRAEALLGAGGIWCDTPAAAAENADCIFTMVGLPTDVEQVMFGESGVLSKTRRGSLVIDLTTSAPSLAQRVFAAAKDIDVAALDAPVSGGDVGARDGTLTIMVGGDSDAFDRALPLLSVFGRRIVHMGPSGAGQHTKMANQLAIATNLIGVCEALLYAKQCGLDVGLVLETIGSGAAGSWSMTNYGPRTLSGDYAPGFKIDHFVKDLRIALEEAHGLAIGLPGAGLAQQLFEAARGQGLGEMGVHALVLTLARLSAMAPLHVDGNTTVG